MSLKKNNNTILNSKIINPNFDTEFWNDCLPIKNENKNKKISLSNKKKKNNNISKSISSTEMNSPLSHINSFISQNQKLNLKENNNQNKNFSKNLSKCRSNSQKAIQSCCEMYERWKISRMKLLEKKEKIRKEMKNKEMEECTWSPNVISHYNEKKSNDYIYKKNNKWYKNHLIKNQEKKLNNMNSVQEGITFKPYINDNVNFNNIFDNGININNDFSNYCYFYRLEKARMNEKEKKNAFKVKNIPKCNIIKKPLVQLKKDQFKKNFHKILFDMNLQMESNNNYENNGKDFFLY